MTLPAQFIRAGGQSLFVLHQQPDAPVARALLICPPMLHELPRGLRLLALLADNLRQHAIASLRFDYSGSGDSSGDSPLLDLYNADTDAEFALAHLQRLHPQAQVCVLGVRAGALVATPLAQRHSLPLLLWQPVRCGATWLTQLRQLEQQECASTLRFPFLRAGRSRVLAPASLMGFRVSNRFLSSVGERRLAELPARTVVLDSHDADGAIALPPALTQWAGQIDINRPFPPASVAQVSATLAAHTGAWA